MGSVPKLAIIGAGLSGLTLALALHQQGIPATVYDHASPNALRILDALGLYADIKTKGYNFRVLHFRDLEGNLTEEYEFGGVDKYNYDGLRIFRHVLIDTLLDELKAKQIPIRFGMKYTHVVEEKPEGVTFAFADDTTQTARLLVGADGIHSKVRKYLYPDLEPKFIGMAGITAAVPTAQLKLPEGYTSLYHHQPDGSEVLIGKQQRVLEQDRSTWERSLENKEAAVRFLQQDNEIFPEIVHNSTSHIDPARINVWPFFIVPKLDRWASDTHQDVYMLALILGRAGEVSSPQAALSFWQSYRQGRVDKILELNRQIDLRRMPENDAIVGVGSGVAKEAFEFEWLYNPDFKGEIDAFIAKQ
ncbi:hypothetical protein K438DRAFT_1910632 [Mycena galopus ATCC 62051]|nr:hypothetical protein K438DRAFT_1910632 [Mycena galopus ATCC 62051]